MLNYNNKDHGSAIAKAAGCILHPENTVISRVTSEGKLMGGVIFKEYTGVGGSINLHCAGFHPNWLGRDLLCAVFHYVFNTLKCKKAFAPVPSTNQVALALDSKLGFKYVTTVPGVFPDGNLVVLDMDRDDCRWLGSE
jgi:RimJ/RimL family protein N-acetyltransferase